MAKKKADSALCLEVPMGELPKGYESTQAEAGQVVLMSRGVHLQLQLRPEEAQTLLKIRSGLVQSGVMIDEDLMRPVSTNVDVIRWMLREIGKNHASQG
jgi:hypothetical protein